VGFFVCGMMGIFRDSMNDLLYKTGTRVRHSIKDEWGIGEIIENRAGTITVFFIGAGLKTLSDAYSHLLIEIPKKDSVHPVLDNLVVINKSKEISYQSLPLSIEIFLDKMPNGFYGERFLDEERNYKYEAHQLSQEILSKDNFSELLLNNNYEEITKRALSLVNKTNLIFPQEKMALKDGLKKPDLESEFSKTLFDLLYGENELKDRFEKFIFILEEIDALKWPIASYFLYIHFPEKYMFVKPNITNKAAELCGWNIKYKPKPNWPTYESILKLSNYIFFELSDLKPRDMIDIQSFLWCIEPGKK
jgi:hypothetical protein